MLFESWTPEEVAQLLSMGFFDPRVYARENPDLDSREINPLMHYLESGWREGRRPSAEFDQGKLSDATNKAAGARNALGILLQLRYETKAVERNINE